jgi:phosphatidylserine/phosphatidylglycerophosphate/cardiolipin synthase-like enzyme
MPAYVRGVLSKAESAAAPPTIEAFRTCTLQPYAKIAVPAFRVSGEVVAYASPDSTYAVTKRLLDGARKSIQIGIYDFTAQYMKVLLLNAMSRGVKVTLMLDVEPTGGEDRLFQELIDMGVVGVPAPACTSKKARFFSSCHEKFIVIDGTWTLVQSGNYSNNSIPLNEKDGGDPANFVKGNRDTGLAVKSKKLAKFFATVLNSDIALELNAPETRLVSAPTPTEALWVEAAPKLIPKRLFPSKRFGLSTPLTVQPVLSPDNYMSVIPAMLRSARKSILIEQQYIRASQEKITVLLQAMRAAMDANPTLDVRIVLGKVFGPDDIAREKANLKLLKDTYGLALGGNVRFIDTKRFVHCHNKMIIVDGDTVLVSSQNWSDSAVSKNREAGLLLTHKGIGKYFTGVFENDWETALTKLPEPSGPSVEPEALRSGGFIQVVPADYREV